MKMTNGTRKDYGKIIANALAFIFFLVTTLALILICFAFFYKALTVPSSRISALIFGTFFSLCTMCFIPEIKIVLFKRIECCIKLMK